MIQLKRELPPHRFVELQYKDLVNNPMETLNHIYTQFGVCMSPEVKKQILEDLERQKKYKSTHRYCLEDFGITRHEVYSALSDVFEEYGFRR